MKLSRSRAPRVRMRQQLSREDRHKTRKTLGPLKNLALPDKLRKRYEQALERYFAFEESKSLNPVSPEDID